MPLVTFTQCFVGVALAPWDVLCSGKIRTVEEEEARASSGENGRALFGDWRRTPAEKAICDVLTKVAAEHNTGNIRAGVSP